MSRVGNQPVSIPTGVTVEVMGQTVTVKGAKGECSYTAPACITVEQNEDELKSLVRIRASSVKRCSVQFGV